MAVKTDFTTLIHLYQKYHLPKTLDEIQWFRQQPDLSTAIEIAALAKDQHGKRYFHQRKIKNTALLRCRAILLSQEDAMDRCDDFHSLWKLLEDSLKSVSGIGELYLYDTAFRIGSFKGIFPERIYLHRGTRTGAIALLPELNKQAKFLNVESLPDNFRYLPPYQIEDILCIYKERLPGR